MSALTFKRLRVGPFQGINQDNPIVIEFPKIPAKTKKRPIGMVTGDQNLGKSSFLHFLSRVTAQAFNLKDKDLINLESREMNGEIEFERNGEKWKVVLTRTTFRLYRFFEAGDDADWIQHGTAAESLSTLIGNVAISPMKLKTDNGANQVDWLFKMLNLPADVLVKTKNLSGRIEEITNSRAKANKEYEFLRKKLQEDPLYVNWERSEKIYAEVKSIDSLKTKLDKATHNRGKLLEATQKVLSITGKIVQQKSDIRDLVVKLQAAQKELGIQESAKLTGEKWLADNQKIDTEYTKVRKEFEELSTYLASQTAWKRIKTEKEEMEQYETLVQQGDTSKSRLKKEKRDLLKGVLPDVEGLEIVTDDEIDGLKTGVYLDGKNPNQLSESELFDLYFKLCRAQGVTMVLIENITSFGTDVVKTLNALAKSGVYVWATEMKRGQKELSIEFVDELI